MTEPQNEQARWPQDAPAPDTGTPTVQGQSSPNADATPGYPTPASQAYYTAPEPGLSQQPGYGPPPGYGQPPGYDQQPGYLPPGWKQAPQTRNPALAGPGSRLGARIIDWLILGVVCSPLWAPVWSTLISQLRNIASNYPAGTNLTRVPAAKNAILNAEGRFLGHMLLVMIAYCIISLAYDWIQHGLWGQTIGKRAVGIVVVSALDGSRLSTGSAGSRAAVYALPSIVPILGWLFGLLNELFLTWDTNRQCLHDKAAHTVVISKSYLAAPSPQTAGW